MGGWRTCTTTSSGCFPCRNGAGPIPWPRCWVRRILLHSVMMPAADRLREGLDRMLAFYGLARSGGKIVPGAGSRAACAPLAHAGQPQSSAPDADPALATGAGAGRRGAAAVEGSGAFMAERQERGATASRTGRLPSGVERLRSRWMTGTGHDRSGRLGWLGRRAGGADRVDDAGGAGFDVEVMFETGAGPSTIGGLLVERQLLPLFEKLAGAGPGVLGDKAGISSTISRQMLTGLAMRTGGRRQGLPRQRYRSSPGARAGRRPRRRRRLPISSRR